MQKNKKSWIKIFATSLIYIMAIVGFGTVASANGGGNICTPHFLDVVSDETTTVVGDGNAVALSFIHPAWTANIPGATWIWSSDPVEEPTDVDDTRVFEKNFTMVGDLVSATLDIATDNFYRVWINGLLIGEEQVNENNFQLGTQDFFPVTNLVAGNNTIKIEVRNKALNRSNPQSNPAGLLYKLSIESKECCSSDPEDPNCCAGDIIVRTNNTANVTNTVTTKANTGKNGTEGGKAKNRVRGRNSGGNTATGGSSMSKTGNANAGTSITNVVNKTRVRVHR